jgi:hypothetical protein
MRDSDIKILDSMVRLGGYLNNRGYVKAWFTWLEWVGLTTILFIAHDKVKSICALIAGIVSAILLFFVAIAAIEKEVTTLVEKKKHVSILILALMLVAFTLPPFFIFQIITAIIASVK